MKNLFLNEKVVESEWREKLIHGTFLLVLFVHVTETSTICVIVCDVRMGNRIFLPLRLGGLL